MSIKNQQSKRELNSPKFIIQDKTNINDIRIKSHYHKESKQYNVQLVILEEIKKLKINLEIIDKNKLKTVYLAAISLNELTFLNKYFKKFKDYLEAFNYLLRNFTKIDRSKVTYLNNNKDIKIVLLFSINDLSTADNTEIIEDEIEIILHNYNSNSSKNLTNFNTVINNLKASLEKFNVSIKEIKSNINNDRIETDKRINDLENNFYQKLNEIKNCTIIKGTKNHNVSKNDGENEYESNKMIEILSKFEDYDREIINIKKNIEDEYTKQQNEINKNNRIFLEKENELSKLIMEKFEDFINKINNLDEKNSEIETNLNNKISELDKKTNICFNELIKKINNKTNSINFSENDLKIKLNGIMGKIIEDNEYFEKQLENRVNQKIEDLKKLINDQILNKIKLFDDKLINLENMNKDNKLSGERIIEKDNDFSINKLKELEEKINKFEKLNELNALNSKNLDDSEKFKKDLQNSLEKNELDLNENTLKIKELDKKITDLFEELSKKREEKKENPQINNEFDNFKKDFNKMNNEIENIIIPKIVEFEKKLENNSLIKSNKNIKENDSESSNILLEEIISVREVNDKNIKETNKNMENKLKEVNNKIQESKKELYQMINKINDAKKEDNKEMNNKLLILKNDLIKILQNKNSIIENKLKSLEGKIAAYDYKVNKITKDNQTSFDKVYSFEKHNRTINENNRSREIETYDLKKRNIDNKIKQVDSFIDFRKIKDSYSTKTLTNSNSNGSLVRNTKMSLYKSNMTDINDSSPSNKEESNLKKKRYSQYNLSNSHSNKNNDRNNIFEFSFESNILKKDELNENFFLFSKIKEIYPYNRFLKLILIYRASRDGDLAKDFHLQCDFIGPNITLVKTKKGYIFGAFTIKNWKHLYKDIKKDDPDNGTEYKDEKAFGFSINKKKIYVNGIPEEEIIYCNNNYGACFKNYFFKIFDKCFRNGGICGKIEECNFDGIDKEYEFNGGDKKFDVEEIEVFQIGFR